MSFDIYDIKTGLHFEVKCRQFGQQDKGISPEGAQDQTAFLTAYYMLGKPVDFLSREIIYPGNITFNGDALFIITGAPYQNVRLNTASNSSNISIQHAKIYQAKKGDRLILKDKEIGFRTILMAVNISDDNKHGVGLHRKPFHSCFPFWGKLHQPIRVIEGPEHRILKDQVLYTSEWQLDTQSNQMGIRLLGEHVIHNALQMISQPVADGVIQLSPNGPIVLMRHRQTTGGYPRVLNVIEVDIDRLAQIPLGSRITFEKISFDEATHLKALYSNALEEMEDGFR